MGPYLQQLLHSHSMESQVPHRPDPHLLILPQPPRTPVVQPHSQRDQVVLPLLGFEASMQHDGHAGPDSGYLQGPLYTLNRQLAGLSLPDIPWNSTNRGACGDPGPHSLAGRPTGPHSTVVLLPVDRVPLYDGLPQPAAVLEHPQRQPVTVPDAPQSTGVPDPPLASVSGQAGNL